MRSTAPCGVSSTGHRMTARLATWLPTLFAVAFVLAGAHWHDGDFGSMLPLCTELRSLFPDGASNLLSILGKLEEAIQGRGRALLWLAMRKLEAALTGQFAPVPGRQARTKKRSGR